MPSTSTHLPLVLHVCFGIVSGNGLLSVQHQAISIMYFLNCAENKDIFRLNLKYPVILLIFIPPPNEVGRGVYWIHLVCPSVRPSVRPSVCRWHGFQSISQVCFGISIWNFIRMLMVAIGRSLLIFSDVTFKMAAWRPYWIFWFPDSNFTLALNIKFKHQRHNTYVYG